MIDPTQGLSPRTRYEFALLERLQQFELTDEALANKVGLPLDKLVDRSDRLPTAFDTELVAEIAEYLIETEEFDEEFDIDEERGTIIDMGMFIYGFMHRNDG